MSESPPYDAEADGLRLFVESKEDAAREAVSDLCELRAPLLAVASDLSDEIPEGGDSDQGNAGNLGDALECLSFMEPADAVAHAREHLPAMVARVSGALEREGFDGAEVARNLSNALGNLGE